jgi:hypothetical protein
MEQLSHENQASVLNISSHWTRWAFESTEIKAEITQISHWVPKFTEGTAGDMVRRKI